MFYKADRLRAGTPARKQLSAVNQVLLRQIAEYFLQPVPSLGISLFRGLHVPLRSLALLLLNAFALVVQITKAFLRCGNAMWKRRDCQLCFWKNSALSV